MVEIIDYSILGLFLLAFILGFFQGFVKKIFSLAGFILALLAVIFYSPKVRVFLINDLNLKASTAILLSIIIVFVITLLLTKIISSLIKPKKSVLGLMDKFLGGLLGLFQMGLFLSGLLILLNFFNFPDQNTKKDLKYYGFTFNLLPKSIEIFESIFPETKSWFNLIEELGGKIKPGNERTR